MNTRRLAAAGVGVLVAGVLVHRWERAAAQRQARRLWADDDADAVAV